MKKNMLRTLVCVLLAASCWLLPACQKNDAPPLEEIYDDAVALIEASHAVNDIMFGQGLPVWEIGSAYAEEHHMYPDSASAAYEYVTDKAPYQTVGQIKEAIAAVYSADYAASLYSTLFDGFVLGTTVVLAQIREDGNWLYQRTDYEPIITEQRVYDYETMRLVKPSSADYVTIEIESRLPSGGETETVRLALVREENGWRLDTPTY